MHGSKTRYGKEPNRLEQTFLCTGINNKQDVSMLDVGKGECRSIVNIDLANAVYSREGYVRSSLPGAWTDTSDSYVVNVNGLWLANTDLGSGFDSQLKHKLPMISHPEAILEFYNGRVYALVPSETQSVLYCSDQWDVDTMDDRQCVVAVFDDVGKVLGRCDDCLVVGTDTSVICLIGDDPVGAGFTQRVVARYGAIKNTLARTTGDKAEIFKGPGRVCVFTTKQGVCIVGNGGRFINLSLDNVSFDYSGIAAAFIREKHGQIHYVVSFSSPESNSFNYSEDSIEITDSL